MKALANKAMEVLDIILTMQVFASIGDAGVVFSLEELRWVEDIATGNKNGNLD